MADNVAITAGSGTTIATDDVTGVHFQRVKLVNSTADSSTPTGVAADPLQVSLANHGANATPVASSLYPGRASLKSGTASATATTSTQVIAGVASNYLYITAVVVHNSSTTDTYVTLQDGSDGTSLMVLPVPAKGGAAISLPVPLLVPTSGNGLFFAAGASVTTMYVTATGYISTV